MPSKLRQIVFKMHSSRGGKLLCLKCSLYWRLAQKCGKLHERTTSAEWKFHLFNWINWASIYNIGFFTSFSKCVWHAIHRVRQITTKNANLITRKTQLKNIAKRFTNQLLSDVINTLACVFCCFLRAARYGYQRRKEEELYLSFHRNNLRGCVKQRRNVTNST